MPGMVEVADNCGADNEMPHVMPNGRVHVRLGVPGVMSSGTVALDPV